MADRDDVISSLRDFRDDVAALVESAPVSAWTNPAHENGWNAHDLLAHIASTSGTAGFVLTLAGVGGAGIPGGSFDVDDFNRQQVSMRRERDPSDILDEIRATIQRDIQAIERAPDELLAREFTAPWGVSGSVTHVITESVTRHLRTHLAELQAALSR